MVVIETEQQDASVARVPAVALGKAIVVTRYDEQKAVVLHPDDFRRLAELDNDLDEVSTQPPAMSELVAKAHELEDIPGKAIEDPEEIKRLLGL